MQLSVAQAADLPGARPCQVPVLHWWDKGECDLMGRRWAATWTALRCIAGQNQAEKDLLLSDGMWRTC